MLQRNCTPRKKAETPPQAQSWEIIFLACCSFMSWVISLVLSTSSGQEMKPAMAAATAPLAEALTMGDRARQFCSRRYSKMGSWKAENTISREMVARQPVQKPLTPFSRAISSRLWVTLSALPTISCCLTTSKGLRTRLASISAQTEAQTLRRGWWGRAARMVSQVQKKVKEQGKETAIWQLKPLNLLRAMRAKFSVWEEPMMRVLMVSRGQKTRSTAMPASPPATPCEISAIINSHRSPLSACPNFHTQLFRHSRSPTPTWAEAKSTHLGAQVRRAWRRARWSAGYSSWKAWRWSIFCLRAALRNSIIIMQHPTLTLIIRYPNDTLHLASQDHLKNKVIVKCGSCDQMEVIERAQREFVCKKCGFQDKVQAMKGINCRRQNCNGELKLVMMATGLMMYECSICDHKEIVNLR